MRTAAAETVSAARRGAERPMPGTLGAVAVRLLSLRREAQTGRLVHVAANERRADGIAAILARLAPGLRVLVLPPWDCLPYDRASPSREVMGRRAATLRRLAEKKADELILVTTADSVLQRMPARGLWEKSTFALRSGAPLDHAALERFLRRAGYVVDERVDEPGEAALRGEVIDLFPAGSRLPYRVEYGDGRIVRIRCYDAATQRTIEDVEALLLEPASEIVFPEPGEDQPLPERVPGLEHRLADHAGPLETLFDYLPEALLVLEPGVETRSAAFLDQVEDAWRERSGTTQPGAPGTAPSPPGRLYMDGAEWARRIGEREMIRLVRPGGASSDLGRVPRFVTQANAARSFARYAQEQLEAGRRVVLAAAGERDEQAFARRARAALGRPPDPVADWEAVCSAPPGSLLGLRLDLESGFQDEDAAATVVAAPDLFGSRAERGMAPGSLAPALPLGEPDLRLGDAVIHIDHGMAALRALEKVTASGNGSEEMVRLEYAGEAKLMVPVGEIDKIWRYGADASAVALDRLDGEAWRKRRAAVEAELARSADRLAEAARAREASRAPKLVPPTRPYEVVAARFPFALTPDQARAVDEVLDDLASGRPMDRLVCGDVGFGKTEVALRAAAAVALSGKQVAVVAPTTVLARQHLQTFRRRFAGLGIEIGHLSRLEKPAEARAVKEKLAAGEVRIVIGTHALAGKGVRFRDLGLLVVDEEQRFGAKHKAGLRALGRGLHVLTLTATPIPRTLQTALVGLQDLSLLATPPARRLPVRTFVVPFDAVTVREALVREARRGGQSFVVCPRIEDIEPMAAQLAALVPELELFVAHGKMPAAEIDNAMVRFADGIGDVLLATNIVESGLDIPRANTMIVWRADRFGLAQLHQLRGRVGRARRRGVAYLMTDPEHRLAPSTEKRLGTVAALDRLGAGFAISARDLDQRGAGDIFGEEQAGHVRLIGTELYQHLLERAARRARGLPVEEDWSPHVDLGFPGLVPESYVPEPEIRLDLYARAARLSRTDDIDALREEIEDRFGPMPDELRCLLSVARLRCLCRSAGATELLAGPQAVALTFRSEPPPGARQAVEASGGAMRWSGGRLVLAQPSETFEEREALASELLDEIAG